MGYEPQFEPFEPESIDRLEAAMNNIFVGQKRTLSFESNGDKYSVQLKPKFLGFKAKVLLIVQIADSEAEISLDDAIDLGKIDQKFEGIDIMLLDDTLKTSLLECLFENEIASLVAKTGLQVKLARAAFHDVCDSNYEREIGVSISKNEHSPINFNAKLNSDLLELLISKFDKLPATSNNRIDDDLPFECCLKLGRTNLATEDFRILEPYDIVFLDDDIAVKNGEFPIEGLGNANWRGKICENGVILSE